MGKYLCATLQRERTIQRNNAVLQAMGIVVCAQELLASRPKKACNTSRAAKPVAACEPRRASHRLAYKAQDPQAKGLDRSTDAEVQASSSMQLLSCATSSRGLLRNVRSMRAEKVLDQGTSLIHAFAEG